MATVHRTAGWKIQVLGNEHGSPHFHLLWPGGRASLAIENGERLVGAVPFRLLAEARAWAAANRELLMAEWQRLNPRR